MGALQDLRLAGRALSRKPGFSAVAILTCALAIGACTSIYSVVYGVLLQPLPYPHADKLVQVWQLTPQSQQGQFSDPNFEDLRDRTRAFAAFAQYTDGVTTVVAGTEPLRARQALVSAQFFEVFETQPIRGRVFLPADRHEGAAPVAVVSHGFWQRALSGVADPASVPLRIGDRLYTVVGVMPPRFDFPAETEIWTPREQESRNPYRTGHNWEAVGRVPAALSMGAARADATAVARQLKAQLGDETAMADVALVPLKEEMTGSVERSLLVLLVAVGCLLAIACANLANLLLVHISGKQREMAVRAALGAGRAALARPLLAEVTLLSGAGGLLGLALGALGPRVLAAVGPANLPRAGEIAISGPVMVFTAGTTLVVALGLSLTAAWRAGRKDVVDDLRQGARGQAGSRVASRLRNGLVVAELAASLMLLVGAGLLGRSLVLLLNQNPGFRTDGVVTVDLSSSATGEGAEAKARLAQFHERVIERLGALPGVAAAGGINRLPMGTSYANGTFVLAAGSEHLDNLDQLGKLFRDPTRTGQAEFRVASARYFDAMGIPLIRGRLFDDRDTADAPHAALITESLARAKWPNADPIGARIQFGNMDGDLRVFTVVGIVGDIHERGLDARPRPTFYADYRQRPRATSDFSITLRTSAPPDSLAGAIRAAIHDLDPAQAPRLRTIDQIVSASVSDRRFTAIVIGAFATCALLLAIVGIYGVLAYAVSQRAQEFGIRLALGAQRRDVWRLVVKQAAALVVFGSAIGLLGSWLSTTLMRSLLFGITPTDPVTFAGVTGLLAATALLACAWPALRATRVDPVTALRGE
jgi:predicted permease